MELEDELTEAFLDGYRVAGEETGYWGRRFLQAVRRNGGLKTAKRMLLPRNREQLKGLDALIEANRPELSVEAIVLQPRFATLFTAKELEVARDRLREYGRRIAEHLASRDSLFPDELPSGRKYVEGARKQIRVNAHERNPRARKICLAHYGRACSVCKLDFSARYGDIGTDFIHVHHLRPMSLLDDAYELDPVADLRPVCPNCHAMLHRKDPPYSIDELRAQMESVSG